MDNEITINWKGRQIDHNPRVFYEEYASEDIDDSLENEFLEIHQYIQEAYTEADYFVQEGTTLKNIGNKFIATLKKIISAIISGIKFIGRQITKLFSINTKADVNSACRELNIKREGRFDINDTFDSNDPLLKYTDVKDNKMSINIGHIFKNSKNRPVLPTTIETVTEQIIYRVGQSYVFKVPKNEFDYIVGHMSAARKNSSKKEQPSAGYIQMSKLLAYMKDPNLLWDVAVTIPPIIKVLVSGAQMSYSESRDYYKRLEKAWVTSDEKIQKFVKNIQGTEQRVYHDDLTNLQSTISNVSDMFIEFQDAKFDMDKASSSTPNKILIQNIQGILSTVETIQMGLNAMVKVIGHPHKVISGHYMGCCSNLVLLDSFVKNLIKKGIPSAYVGLNAYLVASPNIRGSYDKKWEPKWGQSRLTLYPSDKSKVCYKIALNGMGIRSNNTEYSWYKSKSDLKDILAGIHDIGSNKCVIVADRLQENKSVSVSEVNTFLIKNKDRIINNKLGDIHQNNVAYDMNNNIKIIDFGWVNMG